MEDYRNNGRLVKSKKFREATFRMMYLVKTIRVKDSEDGFLYTKPADWGKYHPEANGNKQSPINFMSNDAIFDPSLLERALTINYSTSRETDILNDGQALVVFPKTKGAETSLRFDTAQRSTVYGGPLASGHEYELSEIKFHWGGSNNRGSEHRVNGKAFPMEIQFFHWNSSLYQSLEDAVGKPNGLAAFCLFVQVGRENPTIKGLFADSLYDVAYKGRQKTTNTSFNPIALLPDADLRDYWTYDGSLTAPPCYENTQWIIFRYPLMMSNAQVEDFRRLNNYCKGEAPSNGNDGRLIDNFRPVQPQNDRRVRASFE